MVSTRSYERLEIEPFGQHLLETNDLDPVYVALVKCRNEYRWDLGQIHRWLVAYWCFYHAGLASWMSELEGSDFWEWMDFAAVNDKRAPAPTGAGKVNGGWPRGHERRHFRGEQAVEAVARLAKQYDRPEQMVELLVQGGRLDVGTVMARATNHYLFGPWIAFKVADMIDRCLGLQVSFDRGHLFMFKDPRLAALTLWRRKNELPETARPKDEEFVLEKVVQYLLVGFSHRMAPPLYDRIIGLQEIETILCKWKSHLNGHYPLWNDIDDIHGGLEPWLVESEAAAAFATAMPQRKEQPCDAPGN